jgi:PAS domain S-box-containing protein
MQRAALTGQWIEGSECELRFDDGVIKHIRGTAVPVFGRYGTVRGSIGVFVDITPRVEANLALAESEALLRLTQEASQVGGFIRDMQTGDLKLSDTDCALFGLPVGTRTLAGEDWFRLMHIEDRGRMREQIETLARSGAPGRQSEYRIVLPHGEIRHIEARTRFVRDENGRALRSVGVHFDVTERKRSEDELRASREFLNTILETSAHSLCISDAAGTLIRTNRAMRELFNVTDEEVVGKYNLFDDGMLKSQGFIPRVDEAFKGNVAKFRVRYETSDRKNIYSNKTNSLYLDVTITPIFGTCGNVTNAVIQHVDVTQHTMMAAELERQIQAEVAARAAAQTQLAHAQRMDALGQLAGGIAHDFNNVLMTVQGAATLIKRASGDDRVHRFAQMIYDASVRGSGITGRLLTFSRKAALDPEKVEAPALLDALQEILSHTLGAGIMVCVEASADLPPFVADKGQLETVLINLATNARDAMQGNGTIRLTAALDILRDEDEQGHPLDLQAGSYVCLSLSDDGAGMTAEVLARASEPFFTTKKDGVGTGLGLAMARGFAEQSGGGLHIESTLGEGTTVRMWLPLVDANGDSAPRTNQDRGPTIDKRTRLIVVDDDPPVREIITTQLIAAGYYVLAFASGTDALAVLDTGEDVDVLVSDLSMPGMDGLSLIREAHRRRPKLPAILLTGFATDAAEIAVDGLGTGQLTLLRKPIDTRDLVERVATLVANKSEFTGD